MSVSYQDGPVTCGLEHPRTERNLYECGFSIATVNYQSSLRKGSRAACQVGEAFAWQPRLLVRDMQGLPVPGRKASHLNCQSNPNGWGSETGPKIRAPPMEVNRGKHKDGMLHFLGSVARP